MSLIALVLALLLFAFSISLYVRGLGVIKETVNRLERTVDRMESATKIVATNLADSISRADATDGPAGASADAALRTVPKKRQPRSKP